MFLHIISTVSLLLCSCLVKFLLITFTTELLEENIKISDNTAKRIRQKSEQCRTEDIYHYLNKEEIKDIVSKKDEFIQEAIKVTFYGNEIEKYFENRRTESQIKQYIFDKLEKIEIS